MIHKQKALCFQHRIINKITAGGTTSSLVSQRFHGLALFVLLLGPRQVSPLVCVPLPPHTPGGIPKHPSQPHSACAGETTNTQTMCRENQLCESSDCLAAPVRSIFSKSNFMIYKASRLTHVAVFPFIPFHSPSQVGQEAEEGSPWTICPSKYGLK